MYIVAVALALALTPVASTTDIERDARALERVLIAPCCFTQPVSIHQSPAAAEVRRDVRLRLTAGQTRQQILEAYVAQYGNRILSEPPATGFNMTLYVLPVLMLLASAALVAAVIRRYTRGQPALAGGSLPPDTTSDADQARLDDELRDLD